jgi:hypothetical protein
LEWWNNGLWDNGLDKMKFRILTIGPQHDCLFGIWQLFNIGFFYSSFDVGRSMFDVRLFFPFNVRCLPAFGGARGDQGSMFSPFDVGRSSFKQSVGFQEKHTSGCAAPKLNAVTL